MRRRIQVTMDSPVIRLNIRGDLDVTGWTRQEIRLETDESNLLQESQEPDGYTLVCGDDCALSIPAQSALVIERVNGDVQIKDVAGPITLHGVDGDLDIRAIGSCSLGNINGDGAISNVQGGVTFRHISGDLDVKGVSGDITGEGVDGDCSFSEVRGSVVINRINGDLRLEQSGPVTVQQVNGDIDFEGIQGDIAVPSVNGDISGSRLAGGFTADTVRGDLSLLNLKGGFQAYVAGDAHISLASHLKLDSSMHSGDDIHLAYPGGGDATLDIGSGEGRIYLETPGHTEVIRSTTHRIVLGGGAARITLRAAGQVRLTSPSQEPAAEPESSPGDLAKTITRTVERELGNLDVHLQEVKVREEGIKATTRKIEERLAEARQRLEQRSRQIAERFGGRVPWVHVSEEKPGNPTETREEPAGAVEPVTEDERLIILRMVQEKKLSIDEAEQLLAALDEFDEQAGL